MKNLKISFIEPKIEFSGFGALGSYPLGILYNAASVKKQKPEYEIRCFDEDSRPVLEDNKIVAPFLLESDVVGISTKTATTPRAYIIADKLRDLRAKRKTNKNLQIIIGGIHATALPEEAIEHADCVVKGEGEEVITDVIENRLTGIIKGGKVNDLDSLADPDYSLLEYKKRKFADIVYGNLASISSSRGCSYGCDFCSVWTTFGRKVRIESPEKTFNKIKKLRKNKFKRVFIHDDNFSDNKKYREELFNLLMKEKIGVTYITQDRIDLLQDGDYVKKMKKSGCSLVMFSIESADEQFLKEHKKELDITKAEIGCKLLRKNKIVPYAFCMIDPERPETTKKTIGLLDYLKIKYAQFTIPTPMPGTVLYQKLKSKICKGWEYFNGLTLVTETGEKMREAAEQLSDTWVKFYSPLKSVGDILRLNFSQAALRFYGYHVGRKILEIQPRV